MFEKFKRPEGISDLQILWAIRDIPKSILNLSQKGILAMFLAAIGNREYLFGDLKDLVNIFGLSERRLPAHFHTLEELDFIHIKRPRHYKMKETNEYRMNYVKILSEGDVNKMNFL